MMVKWLFVRNLDLGTDANTAVEGYVEYMVCNDKTCLPPEQVPFALQVDGILTDQPAWKMSKALSFLLALLIGLVRSRRGRMVNCSILPIGRSKLLIKAQENTISPFMWI